MAVTHATAGGRSPPESAPGPSASSSLDGIVGGPFGRSPSGLALRADWSAEEGEARYELALVDRAGATLLALGPFAGDEVVASWRGLGAASGLELMVEGLDGALLRPFPQIGRVALGPIRIRRRHGLLKGRRPRFLVRRKTGAWTPQPAMHREPEMFGRAR